MTWLSHMGRYFDAVAKLRRAQKRSSMLLVIVAILTCLSSNVSALTNGLALTPPMGWSSWNYFTLSINETIVHQIADAMTTNGMKAVGYQFVNVDDSWQDHRGTNGVLVANTNTFPNGIVPVASYVHSKGLKFGIYTARGTNTCLRHPGSWGYEALDAQTFANWGVDYVKDDTCFVPPTDDEYADYSAMSDALIKSGRPIVFSITTGFYHPWMIDVANMARNTPDIQPNFPRVVALIDSDDSLPDPGPGHWNDLDMMEVGNGMTDIEDQAHFSMWCMLAAPLIAGNDIRNMSATTKAILTNPEAIAVDQDSAAAQGRRVSSHPTATGNLEVWCKPLGTDGTTKAVALFNRTTTAARITAHWRELMLRPGPAVVRDLWSHTDLGTFYNNFTATVPSHGVTLLKIVGSPAPAMGPAIPRPGTNYLSDLHWTSVTNGWGPVERDISNAEAANGDGGPITLNGVVYPKGLGAHAFSKIDYYLGGAAVRFQTVIGIDDAACSYATVAFQVLADGIELYASPPMINGSAPVPLDLDVTGRTNLTLIVNDTKGYINCDNGDWADAKLVATPASSPPRVDSATVVTNQLMLGGYNGPANARFYLLSSPNATLPSSQWTRLATNYFDDTGYFYFTNQIDPSARQLFFKLQVP